jgi:ABC-type phosphate transport system substrate-binding protein
MWPIPLQAQQEMVLVGSGGSLASPLFVMWGKGFNRLHPVRVAYVHTSSRDGIEQVNVLHEDFAFGELPLTEKQKNNPKRRLTQIPIAVVSIVPIYNLPSRVIFVLQANCWRRSTWGTSRIGMMNALQS